MPDAANMMSSEADGHVSSLTKKTLRLLHRMMYGPEYIMIVVKTKFHILTIESSQVWQAPQFISGSYM